MGSLLLVGAGGKGTAGAAPPPVTSYANPGGAGDRTASIAASTNLTGSGVVSNIINGTTANDYWWSNGQTTGLVVFDFGSGASRIIDEFKWNQSGASSQGTWRFEGSNDGSSYTTFPEIIDLGGTAGPEQTQTITNSTGYRYYRLRQTGGSTTSGPYVREITFKIA